MLRSIFLTEWKRFFTHRIVFIGDFVGGVLIPLLLNYFLWKSLIQTNEIAYTLPQMLIYLIISNVFTLFTSSSFEGEISREINSHRLGLKLLNPTHYFAVKAMQNFFRAFIKFITIFLPVVITVFIYGTINLSLKALIEFFLLLICSLLINSTFSFILGGLGFWLTEIWGLTAIRVLAIGVLSGTVFPLDILPDSVQKIFLYSPFPYLSYVPSQILLGREVAGISSTWAILIALSWLCFFAVVMYFVWKKGLEKYTAVGV